MSSKVESLLVQAGGSPKQNEYIVPIRRKERMLDEQERRKEEPKNGGGGEMKANWKREEEGENEKR